MVTYHQWVYNWAAHFWTEISETSRYNETSKTYTITPNLARDSWDWSEGQKSVIKSKQNNMFSKHERPSITPSGADSVYVTSLSRSCLIFLGLWLQDNLLMRQYVEMREWSERAGEPRLALTHFTSPYCSNRSWLSDRLQLSQCYKRKGERGKDRWSVPLCLAHLALLFYLSTSHFTVFLYKHCKYIILQKWSLSSSLSSARWAQSIREYSYLFIYLF